MTLVIGGTTPLHQRQYLLNIKRHKDSATVMGLPQMKAQFRRMTSKATKDTLMAQGVQQLGILASRQQQSVDQNLI